MIKRNRIQRARKTLIILLLLTGSIWAQSEDGGQPGAFLRLGIGVRAFSLGGAYTALANDASALYWNPAGLGQIKATEFQGTLSILSMQRHYNYIGFAHALSGAGTIGAGWVNLNVGDIEGRALDGRPTEMFTNSENALLLTWGMPLSEKFYMGATLKYLTHTLQDYSSTGVGFDVGFLIKPSEVVNIGATIQDLSTKVKWDTGSSLEETYPLVTRLGAAIFLPNLPVTICADYEMVKNMSGRIHFGVEAQLINQGGVRIGVDHNRFTAGAFFSIPFEGFDLQTDFGFAQDPIDETYIKRFSLSFKLGTPKKRKAVSNATPPPSNNGYLKLYEPLPTARVIKLVPQFPDYALINVGFKAGLEKNMELGIYRLVRDYSTNEEKKERIGAVRIIKVEPDLAAVKILWINDGEKLKVGDFLNFDNNVQRNSASRGNVKTMFDN